MFQVGKTYRNRNGEYVVQAIDGDDMVIRYVGGGTLRTRASLQARIWENIQFEDRMAREEERQQLAREARQAVRKRTSRASKAKAKPKFGGFEESDFEAKTRGIAWSSREELGQVLAHELSQRAVGTYNPWIVPRKSTVHIAAKDHYDRDTRDHSAAFFVAASENGLSFGLHVGKPGGKVKKGWHWPSFLAALADNDKVRRALRAAMKEHTLDMVVYATGVSYGQVGQISLQKRGFLWQHETADQDMTRRMNWPQLVEYLETIAPGKQCDVYVRKQVPVADAIKADRKIAAQIAQVFEALMPAYAASIDA